MADGEEEQFSLCWNNYNTNLSTGFHESLCRGDLVDVTLAAEGHLVKAHRLVLSVCSPYFQKMFTQMPANQHAFVFLKDVPHAALKDLIQFMYCGEVNVKQDALPTFISTAEALQIKGLTENGDSTSQTPTAQPTHIPIKATTSTPANVQNRPRAVPQRTATRNASYKMDSEDSSDDKATTVVVQAQKRVLQRPVVAQTAKRIKTVDPLDGGESTRSAGQSSASQSTSTHIVQVASASDKVGEPEFIDLPIETLPTKAEPDYGDEGEVEEGDGGEATYVEDSESYGDMKYDESYFTEGEETGKGTTASGFTESYTEGDTSANEAQGPVEDFVIYGDEEYELPQLPLQKPADFQIFESDCKLYPTLLEQLRNMFYECEISDTNTFITENLNRLLTHRAALVYSWTGNQGNIPVMKFVTMKLLMECARVICGSTAKDSSTFIKKWFTFAKEGTKFKDSK